MNQELQGLINHLSKNCGITLTTILSAADEKSWEQNRHIILSTAPFLTLEMAIHRVSNKHKRSAIPEPSLILEAIKYAIQRRKQYIEFLDQSYEKNNDAA